MTQDPDTLVDFTVTNGEQISVTVQAVQCNCLTSAGFDEVNLSPTSKNPDIYKFTVSGNSGDKARFVCLCTFQAQDPLLAYYSFKVTGADGTSFNATDTPKETPEASQVLFFTIQ